MSNCRRRSDCRLCGSSEFEKVLTLAPTPPANAFVSEEQCSAPQPAYPLNLWFCRKCTHVQLLDIVDPSLLFQSYPYVSGTSPVFVSHFEEYAANVIGRFGLKSGDLVVDIGSNDGTLLRPFQAAGMNVLGIDPARAIAESATASGVPTQTGFFTLGTALDIRSQYGAANCITANNVFAHIDDLGDVADGVRELLSPDGVFVFEVSYLLDVYEKILFDTIYHEHLDYHTVAPLQPFFKAHGLELFAAERIDTHGGSLRGFAQLAGGSHAAKGLDALTDKERQAGLHRPETLHSYSTRIDGVGRQLGDLIAALKSNGKRLAGYGAPAKATTLMHHFEIGREQIEFIIDDNPLKQGLFSPGLHVPVLPSEAIAERKPDYLVILAWNFAEPIMQKCSEFAARGGRFIVPLPVVRVV